MKVEKSNSVLWRRANCNNCGMEVDMKLNGSVATCPFCEETAEFTMTDEESIDMEVAV